MMNRVPILMLITGLLLAACGGGGGSGGGSTATITDDGATSTNSGDSPGTDGGTALASKGTIDSFGSIFVNGIEFDTDQAEIYLNGQLASDNDLKLGMVVTVNGATDDGDATVRAVEVLYDARC